MTPNGLPPVNLAVKHELGIPTTSRKIYNWFLFVSSNCPATCVSIFLLLFYLLTSDEVICHYGYTLSSVQFFQSGAYKLLVVNLNLTSSDFSSCFRVHVCVCMLYQVTFVAILPSTQTTRLVSNPIFLKSSNLVPNSYSELLMTNFSGFQLTPPIPTRPAFCPVHIVQSFKVSFYSHVFNFKLTVLFSFIHLILILKII